MTEKVWEGTVRMILCQGLKIVIEISPVFARLYLGPDRYLMAVQQVAVWPKAL
jgi:hypothetical protein